MTISINSAEASVPDCELLLREMKHRSSNDLQLVVSLLALQSERAGSPEVRQALNDAMKRVAVLAQARRRDDERPQSLHSALQQICDALHAQAEPRLVSVVYQPCEGSCELSNVQITTLSLVANELATNALKHAFDNGKPGLVWMSTLTDGDSVIVTIEDIGSPLPDPRQTNTGLGMALATRLMNSVGGTFLAPKEGSKKFELYLSA